MPSTSHNPPKQTRRKPPADPTPSRQFDLFRSFLEYDNKYDHSNTLEQWDSIPKYFLGGKAETLRNADGSAKPYTWSYNYKDNHNNTNQRIVVIHPAYVKMPDGSYKAFFPGSTEELVEEALMKIFTEQHQSIHDINRNESWVFFSLSMITKELKQRKRSRSIDEIKRAIDIMSTSVISIEQNSVQRYRGVILSELRQVDKTTYDKTKQMWAALLPSFYSRAINYLEYRQFNYTRYMQFNSQLTRWLYKRLIARYRHASNIKDYHLSYQEIRQASGLLEIDERKGRQKMIACLNELVKRGVIRKSYKATEKKNGQKITNVTYNFYAAAAFIAEQITANERLKQHRKEAPALITLSENESTAITARL